MASSALNSSQKRIRHTLDAATGTAMAYAAAEVPAYGNLTVTGLVEDLGYLNEARKDLEKVEKILKERLKSHPDFQPELRSDNFSMVLEDRTRTALDQGAAKTKLEELGILPDFMKESVVPTMTLKRL
jgi:hypothetical protein